MNSFAQDIMREPFKRKERTYEHHQNCVVDGAGPKRAYAFGLCDLSQHAPGDRTHGAARTCGFRNSSFRISGTDSTHSRLPACYVSGYERDEWTTEARYFARNGREREAEGIAEYPSQGRCDARERPGD